MTERLDDSGSNDKLEPLYDAEALLRRIRGCRSLSEVHAACDEFRRNARPTARSAGTRTVDFEAIVNALAAEWQVGGMGPDSMYGEFAIEVAKRALAQSARTSTDDAALVRSALHELVHLKQIKRMMESGVATPHDAQKYENTKEAVWERAEAVLNATDATTDSRAQDNPASTGTPAR